MSEIIYKIDGMDCNHCKMAVENAIKGVSGVTKVDVSLEKGEAKVVGAHESTSITKAVGEAGFKVVS